MWDASRIGDGDLKIRGEDGRNLVIDLGAQRAQCHGHTFVTMQGHASHIRGTMTASAMKPRATEKYTSLRRTIWLLTPICTEISRTYPSVVMRSSVGK